MIEWRNQLPKKPGIYMRNNPSVKYVVRQDLFLIGDALCTNNNGAIVRLSEWPGAKTFWWYGPIPVPPYSD